MKKLLIAGMMLVLLAMAGCVEQPGPSEPVQPPAEAVEPAEPAPPEAPAEPPLMRPGSAELTMSIEGQEEPVAVTLWQTESFSMYIPAEGWVMDEQRVWSPEANEQVSLTVREYAGQDIESTLLALAQDFPDQQLSEEGEGLYSGSDDGGLRLLIRLAEGPEGCFAVCGAYPEQAAEGFGARMGYLIDTFVAAPRSSE